MTNDDLGWRFATLSTAHVADACMRAGVAVRCAPAGIRPLAPGGHVAGRVLPARHAGSVDVFLEALDHARSGDVLVVDDGGRLDQACVGDLVAQEAQAAGVAGLVVWGLHRDSADILAIGLPVWSLGALPAGPPRPQQRCPDTLDWARIGDWKVTTADVVLADDDGVLFVPGERVDELVGVAESIRDTERRQAERIRAGASLRSQLDFAGYLSKRRHRPTLSFRDHLRGVGGAIEE